MPAPRGSEVGGGAVPPGSRPGLRACTPPGQTSRLQPTAISLRYGEPTRRRSAAGGSSSDRLKIGPHHVGHSTDSCVLQRSSKVACRFSTQSRSASMATFEADLVSVFETVRHRLGRVVGPDWNALNHLRLDALGTGRSGEADDTQRRMVHFGQPGFSVHREPGLERILGGHAVEPKGGEQADHAVRHPPAGLRQTLMLCDLLSR